MNHDPEVHIEMAERELQMDPNYDYNLDDDIDSTAACAHALIAIAKSLASLIDRL